MQSKKSSCVVITGGTRGIGLGLSQAFLTLGWSVVISARNRQQLQEVKQQLQQQFGVDQVHAVHCEVTRIEDLDKLWQEAITHCGHVDVWINNAGTSNIAKPLHALNSQEIENVIQTNVLGCMLGAQVALKGMLEQGFGQIFNMEGWGSRGEWSAGMTPYATSKRAVAYFSQALYKETKNTPIRVGTLSPGMVTTDLLVSSWQAGDIENWRKMKWLFMFIIDPPQQVCGYLAEKISQNKRTNVRIVWMTPWRLAFRFFQPYYWKRNPIEGTALNDLK